MQPGVVYTTFHNPETGANVVTRVVLVHPGALYQLGGRFNPAGALNALVA